MGVSNGSSSSGSSRSSSSSSSGSSRSSSSSRVHFKAEDHTYMDGTNNGVHKVEQIPCMLRLTELVRPCRRWRARHIRCDGKQTHRVDLSGARIMREGDNRNLQAIE